MKTEACLIYMINLSLSLELHLDPFSYTILQAGKLEGRPIIGQLD